MLMMLTNLTQILWLFLRFSVSLIQIKQLITRIGEGEKEQAPNNHI